jgi:hypothetical protein
MFESADLRNLTTVQETVIKLGKGAPNIADHIGTSIFKRATNPFIGFLHSFGFFVDFCEHLTSLPQVQDLFRNVGDVRYKVVLIDAFMCECFLPLAYLANAPVIQVAPSHLMPWNYAAIGSKVNYAQVR